MKWQPCGACSQCGAPFFIPDLSSYSSFMAPPARRSCKCLNGPVKNVLDALGVGTQIANLIATWKGGKEKE